MTDTVPNAPEQYVLDFTGTDHLHTWRLRAEPHMEADEVDEFRHGDKISAVRDPNHPGWLKLVQKSGWVKEAHEGLLVWKVAQSLDSDPGTCTSLDASFNMSKAKDSKNYDESGEDKAPSFTGASASGSKSNDNVWAYRGPSYRLGNDAQVQWFTGQSYRLDPVPCQASSTDKSMTLLSRPRWADMADSGEDSPIEAKSQDEPEFFHQQVINNKRKKTRNKALLQRKNKTKLCSYVVETGYCPFSEKCWFAHSDEDMRANACASA